MYSYEELRNRYTTFIYEGYDIEESAGNIGITYHFTIEGLASFAPSWSFLKTDGNAGQFIQDETFRQLVFSLGMVELISYWKIACPPHVIIKNATLSDDQIAWWKSLYFNGLGEFYYTNNISENEKDFMTIEPELGVHDDVLSLQCEADIEAVMAMRDSSIKKISEGAGCMVPIGGGKDSIVSLDVLSEYHDNVYAYIINPRGATINTVRTSGFFADGRHVIAATRTLDKNMLELNRQGYLNGHTPFSAIVAFSSTIAAYMHGITYIALSNESSANESTVPGSTINHQYSKSFQFERDFHEYEAVYIQSGTYYFSLLRPLSEFQIAADFAQCREFHSVFRSCNAGSKQDIWCGHCPKCLFVWLILSPFIKQSELCDIFGTNMAQDESMKECFDKLVGIAGEKPFECVGSVSEINAAVTLAIRDMKKNGEDLPFLFRYYCETGLYEKTLPVCEDYYHYYDNQNLLPEDFETALNKTLTHRLKERAPKR